MPVKVGKLKGFDRSRGLERLVVTVCLSVVDIVGIHRDSERAGGVAERGAVKSERVYVGFPCCLIDEVYIGRPIP